MIWFADGSSQGNQASLYADTRDDVQNDLEEFGKKNHLKHGSNCFCIEDSSVHMMMTDETWKQI